MTGAVMRKLAEALDDVGFVIKEIKAEEYGQYEKPSSGEKYTGLLFLKIRSVKDEEADAEKLRARKEAEKAEARAKERGPVVVLPPGEDIPL